MREVAELNGDGIADELRDAIHAINEALGGPVSFRSVDWSLARRESGLRRWTRASNSRMRSAWQ